MDSDDSGISNCLPFTSPPGLLDTLWEKKYLGSGSYGFVFQALSKVDSSLSAVKITFADRDLTDPVEKANEKSRILREYHSMVSLRCEHPNIVKVYGLEEKTFSKSDIEKYSQGIGEGASYFPVRDRLGIYACRAEILGGIEGICIQMELCGSTLRRWVSLNTRQDILHDIDPHKRLKFQVHIVQDLVAGLRFLHSHNLIHRDLKPENVMFSTSSDMGPDSFKLPLKIGDFGLCRRLHSDGSKTGSLTSNVGTVEYRSPEAFTKEYAKAADWYSLGLIMWQVLQLIPASKTRYFFDRLVNDKEEELVENHPLIKNAREIILNLTRKDVGSRVTDFVIRTEDLPKRRLTTPKLPPVLITYTKLPPDAIHRLSIISLAAPPNSTIVEVEDDLNVPKRWSCSRHAKCSRCWLGLQANMKKHPRPARWIRIVCFFALGALVASILFTFVPVWKTVDNIYRAVVAYFHG